MSGSVTYVPNPGWSTRLVQEARAIVALEESAQELRARVLDAIPVVTGATKAEYGAMNPEITQEGALPAIHLPITSHIWHIIEFGSVNNESYRPIARGADAAGLKFDASAGGL